MRARSGLHYAHSLTTAALLGLLPACTAGGDPLTGDDPSSSASQPILGGTPDDGDPATVLIGGGGSWCTGTIIAPQVVLTAGHCISPKNNFVYLGPQYLGDAGGSFISVANSYTNPAYQSTNFTNADVGVVILKSPANVVPCAINTVALDASYVGADLHIVGFGVTQSPAEPIFTKMSVDVTVAGITPKEISVGPAICSGDSGGPGLLSVNGAQVVAGVNSWHSSNASGCGGNGGLARVDLYAAWIQAQIDAVESADGGADGGADAEGTGGGTSSTTSSSSGTTSSSSSGMMGSGGSPTSSSSGTAGSSATATTSASTSGGSEATPSTHASCEISARESAPMLTPSAAAALVAMALGARRRRRRAR